MVRVSERTRLPALGRRTVWKRITDMSDVLIIAGPSPTAQRLREALELDGYIVTQAPNLIAALPALYLSPCALSVILTGEAAVHITEEALLLATADPGPLARHSYCPALPEVDLL